MSELEQAKQKIQEAESALQEAKKNLKRLESPDYLIEADIRSLLGGSSKTGVTFERGCVFCGKRLEVTIHGFVFATDSIQDLLRKYKIYGITTTPEGVWLSP